ncbi:hypothetical protein QWY86_07215 [Pedobacter aquatilis]|uniref:hypothetical protein n=1 Tax=Pedobacter aquatilis TaxID=351343 RepID=UPI0025B3F5DC|nr:hypothetical protein [Pedobacter aquatilis]MDN3586446.1 hypothetical protein [Pedobacter aquatilis]
MLKFGFLLSAYLQFSSLISNAQNTTNLSFGAEIGLPSGNFSGISAIGTGGSIKLDVPVLNQLAVTVNAGFMNFFGRRNQVLVVKDFTYIPIKGGLKYYLSDGFYAEAQAGTGLPINEGQKTLFVWSPGLGNIFKLRGKGLLDVGLRYEGWTGKNDEVQLLNSSNTKGFAGLRVAYSFAL